MKKEKITESRRQVLSDRALQQAIANAVGDPIPVFTDPREELVKNKRTSPLLVDKVNNCAV